MTGIPKAVGYALLSVGMVHIKVPLLLIEKSSLCGGDNGFTLSLSGPLPHV